jgi:hypothetical protein
MSLKRSPLQRKSGLKPGRPKKKPSLAEFHAAVCEDGWCALGHLGGCSGRLESHHAYPKQRLKDNPQAYTDPRCGVPLCLQHHQQVEWRRIPCPRPPYLDEFLADYGLPDPEQRQEAA